MLASIADELEDFGKGQQGDGGGTAEPRRQRRVSQRGGDALSPPVTPRRTSSRSLMRSLGSLARGCCPCRGCPFILMLCCHRACMVGDESGPLVLWVTSLLRIVVFTRSNSMAQVGHQVGNGTAGRGGGIATGA